jgi:hypothetical protein
MDDYLKCDLKSSSARLTPRFANAIASLTGSRQGTIKQILEQYKDDIDSHNQTYGLNPYSNRKHGKDIAEIIKLAELIPNGVD